MKCEEAVFSDSQSQPTISSDVKENVFVSSPPQEKQRKSVDVMVLEIVAKEIVENEGKRTERIINFLEKIDQRLEKNGKVYQIIAWTIPRDILVILKCHSRGSWGLPVAECAMVLPLGLFHLAMFYEMRVCLVYFSLVRTNL